MELQLQLSMLLNMGCHRMCSTESCAIWQAAAGVWSAVLATQLNQILAPGRRGGTGKKCEMNVVRWEGPKKTTRKFTFSFNPQLVLRYEIV